jgi:hypothetical protein
MRCRTTSLSEQTDNSLKDECPSPQTPLDAGEDFVHSPAAIMNQRKLAFPLDTLDKLNVYTPPFPSNHWLLRISHGQRPYLQIIFTSRNSVLWACRALFISLNHFAARLVRFSSCSVRFQQFLSPDWASLV